MKTKSPRPKIGSPKMAAAAPIRIRFYAEMAALHGAASWKFPLPEHGRNGRPVKMSRRDRTRAVDVDTNADALEAIRAAKMLQGHSETPEAEIQRYQAALTFRSAMEGAQLTTLRSPGMEVSCGGSGVSVTDHRMDCWWKIEAWRRSMPQLCFLTMDRVVYRDEWLHETPMKDAVISQLCRALDAVSVEIGLITPARASSRWG